MDSLGILRPLFFRRRFFRALPEFFRSRAEFSFWRGDADRDRLGLRDKAHAFQAVSKAVTKNVRTKGGPFASQRLWLTMGKIMPRPFPFEFTFDSRRPPVHFSDYFSCILYGY
jgi:hypothetical protein